MLKEEWQFANVKLKRQPKTGIVTYEEWSDENRSLHRWNDEPAVIKRDKSTGNITETHYYFNDRPHRENGEPAVAFFTAEGKLKSRLFFVNGKYSRPDGLPHYEKFNPDNGVMVKAQYRVGSDQARGWALHREKGPAELIFDPETGALLKASYYLDGRKRKSLPTPAPGL